MPEATEGRTVDQSVTIPASTPLPAFLSRPADEDPHPAVLIYFEIFGLNDHMRSVARRLAEAGFTALVPDFFRHEPTPYSDFPGARQVASSLSDTRAMEETGNALDYLEAQPFVLAGKIAILGFCMGGRLAFLSACHHADRLRAAVDLYGARVRGGSVHPGQTMTPLAEAGAIQCPLLLFFGERDQSIPPDEIEEIRQKLTDLGKSFQIQVYPGAEHGFFCEARPSYHHGAAEDAWRRTLQFLQEQIGPESVQ